MSTIVLFLLTIGIVNGQNQITGKSRRRENIRFAVCVYVQQLTWIKFPSKVMTFMFVQYFSIGVRLFSFNTHTPCRIADNSPLFLCVFSSIDTTSNRQRHTLVLVILDLNKRWS